jgi:hypothetical protein
MSLDSEKYEGVKYRVTCSDEGMWYVQERYYGHPWLGVSPGGEGVYETRDEAVTRMFELVKARDNPKPETTQKRECVYEEDIRETWEYIK